MIIACVTLYTMSVWHWAVTVHDLLGSVSFLVNFGSEALDYCAPVAVAAADPLSGSRCREDLVPPDFFPYGTPSHACVTATPLLISVGTKYSVVRHTHQFHDRLSLAMLWSCGERWSCGSETGQYRLSQQCSYYRLLVGQILNSR